MAPTRARGRAHILISIRVTLMPQGAVAASMVRSSFSLMVSRWESISIQLHGAEHGPHIGHGEIADGTGEIVDLVAASWGIHHLHEADGVDGDVGVVPGDHLLGRDVQHLLHHDDLVADAVDVGIKTGWRPGRGCG